jgi:hypothetical protein
MFNLLVKLNGWADGRDFLALERVFEFTDAGSEARKPDGTPDFDRLLGEPALFVAEIGSSGDRSGRVGTIRSARISGRRVEIDYTFDGSVPPVPIPTIEKLTRELSIGSVELSRTHWAVKDVDLFRVLFASKVAQAPTPKVFNLDGDGIDDRLLSVMMPFDARFDQVYACIQGTAAKVGMQCHRADDIWKHEAIIQDIISLICSSRVVVADCTGRNPNVFYETGIAHTLGRDVILITQAETDIPFNLRHLRFVPYLDNSEGRAKLSGQLQSRIKTLLS